MTITQVITPLPAAPNPLTDTPAVFSEKAAAFVAAQQVMVPEINAWRVQANALETNVNARAQAADDDRATVAADKLIVLGYKDTAQFAADTAVGYRNQAQSWAGAAASSAATIGTTAAFSDANPVVKNAADNSKQLRFNLANLTTGIQRVIAAQNRDGTMALTDDPDIVRHKKFFDAGANLTINYNDGIRQKWTPGTGSKTLVISNWPAAGGHAELMIEGVGLGLATITWPSYIWWLRYDGTYAQSFNYTLATLQGSGVSDFIVLWSCEGSNRVFGKVVR